MEKTKRKVMQSTEKAEDIVDDFLQYKNVGDTVVCVVKEVYSVNDDTIKMEVSTPGKGTSTWTFQKPYTWESSNPFVELCENRDLTRNTFDMLVNEKVLVKKPSTYNRNILSDNGNWQLIKETSEEYIGDESSSNIHKKEGYSRAFKIGKYVLYASSITVISLVFIFSAVALWFIAVALKYTLPLIIFVLLFMLLL